MSWDVHARGTHLPGCHVKIRWRGLNPVHDVWVDCPAGVHRAGDDDHDDLFRDEMSAFTKPIDAHFQWSDGDEPPPLTLYWSDAGEECHLTLALEGHGDMDTSGHSHLRTLADRLLHPSRSL